MNKLNKKLLKLDEIGSNKKLRKIHNLETDLRFWDVFVLDGEEVAFGLSGDGYKQYEIETGKKMNIPVRIGNKRGKQ